MSRDREVESLEAANGGAERAGFVARLQEIVRHWPSADRLARAVGVSPSAFRKWLKGEAEPSRERLVALADAAGVPIAWLAKGEGAPPRFASPAQHGANRSAGAPMVEPDRFLLLPKRVVAAVGDDPTSAYPASEYIAFRHEWIRAAFGVAPEQLAMEVAAGEAMQPTIRDGDLLLVDTTDQAISGFGIYVVEVSGQRLVKRMQRKMDGSLVLISDNRAYQPDLVPPELAPNVTVVGRVVWAGGRV